MMKTKIVLCCDKCEKVLGDNEKVYGFFDKSCRLDTGEGEVYICEECYNKIIDEAVEKIINEAIKNHEFYIGLDVSNIIRIDSTYAVNNHKIDLGKLYFMKRNEFFPLKDYTYFVYKTPKDDMYPFYISSSNKTDDIRKISELLTNIFKELMYYGSLSMVKTTISTERQRLQYEYNSTACSASSINGAQPNTQLFG